MARNRGFNGSGVNFAGTSIGLLRRCALSALPYNEVDVTDQSDEMPRTEAWLTDYELILETVGSLPSGIARGDKGTLSIFWNDNKLENFGTNQFELRARTTSGARNAEIVTQWHFRPTSAPPAP